MENMKAKFTIHNTIEVKNNNIILSGNDHFIGKDEKRRNTEIIHIEFPYTSGNYALFYKGSNETLKTACNAICILLNTDKIPEYKKSELYKELITCLHITHHISTKKRHSKLDGINSLSTCCLDNLYCIERIKCNDSICSHCYSATQQKTQLALQDRNTINGIILRNIVIPSKYWKRFINPFDLTKFFRIESFGDIQNKTQALNYIEFIKAFPKIHFAIWSKNIGIWHFAFSESEKPKNCSFVYSCNKINICELHILKTYSFINHIFTVYDKKYISLHDITINCGGRCCLKDCIKKGKGCYFADTETIINESLK